MHQRLRVGDGERDEAATRLAGHYADGRLTFDEFEIRMGRALTATTRGDLEVLGTDLEVRGPTRRTLERVLGIAAATALAALVLTWSTIQAQTPPTPEVVCGPQVSTDCYWPAGVEPVDYP